MNDIKNVGIKQQLQAASSVKQIESLLAKIRSYKFAQTKTVRKCERVAAARLKELCQD